VLLLLPLLLSFFLGPLSILTSKFVLLLLPLLLSFVDFCL
jgi:hypothetical protein